MKISDKLLLQYANKSKTATDFCHKLGYKSHSSYTKLIKPKLIKLNFDFSKWKTNASRFTNEQILLAANNCTSVTATMRKLGYNTNGGRRHTDFRKKLEQLGIIFKTPHKVLDYSPRRGILDYLVINGPFITTSRLRIRLIKEKYKQNKCEICGQDPIWNNKPLSMHLDHADGNNRNSRLENLQILCPNCHTQTITYGKQKTNTPTRS